MNMSARVIKCFEWSNRPDTALYKNTLLPFLACILRTDPCAACYFGGPVLNVRAERGLSHGYFPLTISKLFYCALPLLLIGVEHCVWRCAQTTIEPLGLFVLCRELAMSYIL